MNSFDSTVGRLLAQRIAEEVKGREYNLARNSARSDEAAATARNYGEQTAYVLALDHVLEWCKEIEDELLGRGKKGSSVPSK